MTDETALLRHGGSSARPRGRGTRRRLGLEIVPLVAWVLASAFALHACSAESPAAADRPVEPSDRGQGDERSARRPAVQASRATDVVEIGFDVPGTLSGFSVIEGQRVAQGAVIARLDPRDYQIALDAAVETAGAAKAERDRRMQLFEDDVISAQELERSERSYEVAAATVELRRKALDDTVLRAPFDGTIARRIANDFESVRAKQEVVRLRKSAAHAARSAE